jgi:hypothetical protein
MVRRRLCECKTCLNLKLSRLPWFPTPECSTAFPVGPIAVCTGSGRWVRIANGRRLRSAAGIIIRHATPDIMGDRSGAGAIASRRHRMPAARFAPGCAAMHDSDVRPVVAAWPSTPGAGSISPVVATQLHRIVRRQKPLAGGGRQGGRHRLACCRNGSFRQQQDQCRAASLSTRPLAG